MFRRHCGGVSMIQSFRTAFGGWGGVRQKDVPEICLGRNTHLNLFLQPRPRIRLSCYLSKISRSSDWSIQRMQVEILHKICRDLAKPRQRPVASSRLASFTFLLRCLPQCTNRVPIPMTTSRTHWFHLAPVPLTSRGIFTLSRPPIDGQSAVLHKSCGA